MTLSDPVADFLTRIRNAINAQHRYVDIPLSKLKQNIAEILKEKGFIENYIVKSDKSGGTIRIFLKYLRNRASVIRGLKRASKPGLRKYVNYKDIPMFFGGLGLTILSTSKGVMAGVDAAKNNVGGELLCLVW
ncbi:MAG: 30S ribosomal protein S8 [Chlamydiae bacterium]|nr:30S ribosomal protein S8 [Chlamydiota bacterium]